MPKYYDKLPEAGLGAVVKKARRVKLSDVVHKPSLKNPRKVVSNVRGALGELGQEFTTYDTEGFVPVRNPRDLASNILEGIRTATLKGEAIGSDVGNVAAQSGQLPLANFLPAKQREQYGRITGVVAPYIAATAVAPEVVGPVLTGQAIGLAASAGDRYQRGEIGGAEAIFEIVGNVGPEAAGYVLGRMAKSGLKQFAETPEGKEAIEAAAAEETAKDAGKMPSQRQFSKMSPSERVAYSKARSVEEFEQIIAKQLEQHDIRIARADTRLKNPIQERPADKPKGGTYLGDIFDVVDSDGNKHRYPLDIVRADSGLESWSRPIIEEGTTEFGPATVNGKPVTRKSIHLSSLEAENVIDLYRENRKPSLMELRRALERANRADVVKKGTPDLAPEVNTNLRSYYKPMPEQGLQAGVNTRFRVGDYEMRVGKMDTEEGLSPLSIEFKRVDNKGLSGKGLGLRNELKAVAEFVNDIASNNPERKITAEAGEDTLSRIYQQIGFNKVGVDPNNGRDLLELDIDRFREVTKLEPPAKPDVGAGEGGEQFAGRLFRGKKETKLGQTFTANEVEAKGLDPKKGEMKSQNVRLQNGLKIQDAATAKTMLGLPPEATMDDLAESVRQAGYDGMMFDNGNVIVLSKPMNRPPNIAAKARAIRDYADNHAPKTKVPLERPSTQTPALRQATATVRGLNTELIRVQSQVQDLQLETGGDKHKLSAALAKNAEAAENGHKPPVSEGSLNVIKARIAKNDAKYAALYEAEDKIKTSLAAELRVTPDKIPLEVTDQVKMLTPIHGDIIDKLPVLGPSQARQIIKTYEDIVKATTEKFTNLKVSNTEGKKAKQELLDFIKSGATAGRVPAHRNTAAASRLFREWQDLLKFRNANPRGIRNVEAASESLTNFVNLAWLRAFARSTGRGVNLDDRIKIMLRDLSDIITTVSDPASGPGGRVSYVDADGVRHVGTIKVTHAAADIHPGDWLVDFVPQRTEGQFSSLRDVIPGMRVKDLEVEYRNADGLNAIEKRNQFERDVIREVRSEESVFVARGNAVDLKSAQLITEARQRQMRQLEPLRTTAEDIRPIDELNRQVDNAYKAFYKTLLPEIPGSMENVTKILNDIHLGFIDQINRELPRNATAAQNAVDARNALKVKWREYIFDKSGLTLDDPTLNEILAPMTPSQGLGSKISRPFGKPGEVGGLSQVDAEGNLVEILGDPVPLMMMLRGRGLDPEDIVREYNMMFSKLPRKLRGALNFVQGRVFPDMHVGGINAGYSWARKAAAENIAFNFDRLTLALRRAAVTDPSIKGEKFGIRPKMMRAAYGDRETKAVLKHHWNPVKKASWSPELTGAMNTVNDLPDVARDNLLDIMSQEPRWMIDFPELWDDALPQAFKTVGVVGRKMVSRLEDMAAADKGASVSQGFLNSMLVSKDLHADIGANLMSKGHPIAVLAKAAEISHNRGLSLREVLTSGENLLRAEPLAYWNTSLMQRITDQVKQLAPEGTVIDDEDITNQAGKWSIRGLDKFKVLTEYTDPKTGIGGTRVDDVATKDLQDSLRQLEKSLNGLPDWKGLQGLSQSIASMVLSLDANILSVQAYVATSAKILYDLGGKSVSGLAKAPVRLAQGKPLEAVKGLGSGFGAMGSYVNDLRAITSDEGFQAWRTINHDRLQYYSSLGLSIGQESFIAGPKMNKMPFEDLPFLGWLPRTAREFNDLQFNRLLLYMKVDAIDRQLNQAQFMRRLSPFGSNPFLKLPGVKNTMDQMADTADYLHGQPEEVVKAAIRTVNNRFGGIDLNAQGIAQWRQASEQIMTITPGFFRAQAGMYSTALTRLDSVEGWLAVKGIAEEVVVAAGVATLLGFASGNLGRVNYDDPSRADWMAVPFDNDYVSIIPRVGIPRLAARLLRETIDAGQGEGFDAGPSIKAFAQGRMSPALNATLGPVVFDQDFLGRKYRDKKDRAIASLTSFMPIFIENLVTEARETQAQDGWGAAFSETAKQTPLQFAGKNMVPRHPIEKLDEVALQYSSVESPSTPRKWYALSPEEREQLLLDPKTKGAQEDLDYYEQRRESAKGIQIEAQFANADQLTTQLRTGDIRFPDGEVESMSDLYDRLLAGDITGDDYRTKYQWVNGQINAHMESMELNLKSLGVDLTESHEKRVAKLREVFEGGDEDIILTQLALWDSEQIQPENYTNEVTVQTPNGPVTFMETDWDEFQNDKDEVFERYPTNIRLLAATTADKWDNEGVTAYKEASKLRNAIEDMPRYRGLDNTQADKIDAMTKSFRDLSDMVRMKIGLPGFAAPLPEGMTAQLRKVAIKQFVDTGFIKTQEDLKLAVIAVLMETKPALREAMRGPEQLETLINNPEVLMFYPYLMGRVPVYLRGHLPPNLQPEFNVQNRLAERTG